MESPPEHLTYERVELGSAEPGRVEPGRVELRRWRASDADLCFRLVSESLEHLRPWMPWATSGYGPADAADYLDRCEASWAAGTAFQYLIIADGSPAGSAGLMARVADGGLEIGYWVHPACTGRGVATAASAALTDAALALPGIDHVEIHHDQLNLASGRVPAKLGYTHVETHQDRAELAPGDSGTTLVWRITPALRYRQ
jgi:ribosomal-protein-serine acetyltransferase